MSPAHLETLLVQSAKWILGREQSRNIWWNPGVLTRENPDKTNPGLSGDEAEDVFEELRRRKLFKNDIISIKEINNGEPFLVHRLNEDKKAEWIKTINEDGFVELFIKPWARHLWGRSMPAFKGFLSAIILAFFCKLASNCADRLFTGANPSPKAPTSTVQKQ